MKVILHISLFFASMTVCVAQTQHNMKLDPLTINCDSLPETFESFDDALTKIESAKFRFTQNFKTTRRSGVMAAYYYSCESKDGYLILTLDGLRKIYGSFPRIGWKRLLETNDLDGYYQDEIRDNYKLVAREIN